MKKISLQILFVLLVLCFSMVLPASAATTMNITSHDDGEIISWADSFKLKWSKVTGATGYRISIGIEKNNVVTDYLVDDKYTTSTSFTATSYLPETNCKLKIQIGAVKSSSQYLADSFTVQTLYLYLSHAPAITNGGSSAITGNGATLEMSVDRDYGYAIEDCGFYVGTSSTVSKMTKYSFWDYSTSYGATTKGTKYMTISDLEPGTKYYYRAYAVNAAGEDYSSAKNFTTSKGSLGKPVITYPEDRITCYTGSDITLKWESVSGADSYNYYIKQLSGAPNTANNDEAYVDKWEGSTTKRSYTLTADKLVPGYWYKFVVKACADDAEPGWSAWHYVYVEKGSLEKAKVVSPSNTATYPGYQSIKFDWDDVPGADSYNYHIKRLAGIPDRTSNNEPSIGTPWTGKTTSTSYTLASSNVIPGSWYKFVVEAVSDTANPSWSEWVYCYIEEVKLEDPEIIKPTEWTEIYEGDSIVVDWDSVAGADGYRCHIKQLAGKPDTSNTNEPAVDSVREDCGTSTKYTLSGSKVHGGYWYKFVVEAYTKSGTSTWSDWVYVYVPEKGTLDRATISSPSDNKVYKWDEDILFTWAKVPNATNYTYYVKQLKGDPDYSSDEAAINSWSGTTNATNRFFTLPGDQVLPDVWYKFVVKAEADGYDSSWSKYTYIQIPDREDWIHAKLNTATSTVMAEAFANNQLLRTFDASESTLETIGARAFENCVNLRSIFLPSSVTSIEDNTFSNCPQLTIHCYKDSYVHQYAVKKNIPVVLYGVVEQADMIELSKDNWTINFSEAAQAVFTVSSTGKWTATSSANWLTLSASSGLNATNVIFKAAANTGKTARTATVTFTCGKASATVTVSQSSVSGKACTMVLNHTSWMPSSSDLTREIVVKSEKGFTVSSNKSWLDYTTENAAIHAKVTASALNTTQTGTLTITCKNCGKAQTVTVAIKSVPAPTGVTAESSEPHAVVISWGKIADATYTIERSTNGTSGWTQIAKNLTSTKYVDGPNNINASATYYYRVTACKGTAYSGASAVVKATTPPEQTLKFIDMIDSVNDTTLAWTGLEDATYKLSLKNLTTNTHVNKLADKDVGSGTTYSLPSGQLANGYQYKVWVGAYNDAGRLIGQTEARTFSFGSTAMTVSSTYINYLKIREGKDLDAYKDEYSGKWTIGYGHTGPEVVDGMKITEAQAEQLLKSDLNKFEKIVNDFLKQNGVTLAQNQFDAVVDLCYNAGSAYLTESKYKLHKTLLKYKNGDVPIDEAFRMFGAIHHANSVCVDGLFFRRCEEGAMFYKGVYNVKYDWNIKYSWWNKTNCSDLMPDNWYPTEYGYKEPVGENSPVVGNLSVSVGSNTSYMTSTIMKALQNSDCRTELDSGRVVIFMFEGCGTDSSTDMRYNATCVVVGKVNGADTILFECANCSTIPDCPKDPSKNKGTDMPTLKAGTYTVSTTNHRGEYASLNVKNAAVVRFSGTDSTGYDSTSSAINIHRRYSNNLSTNSAGCLLIGGLTDGYSEYTNFLRAVGVISNTTTYNQLVTSGVKKGLLVVDRTQAASFLSAIYGAEGASKVD